MAEMNVDKNVKKGEVHEDWQALEKNWKGRMSYLYNNEMMSDITFKVKDERFKAHKFVMASVSSVFYAMFFGPVAEIGSEIEIVDCPSSDDFTEFLKFMYTEELSLTWENLFAVAYLAKKYYIPSLTEECCKFLSESLTVDNVVEVLNLCVAAGEAKMAGKCLHLIKTRIEKLTRKQEFLELDLQALKSILTVDTLDLEEFDLFLAVDKWCEYQLEKQGKDVTKEAKREVLGDAANLVRFPTIPLKELSNHCYPTGLLTKDQFLDLVRFHTSDDIDKLENIDKERIPFGTSKRRRSNYSIWKGFAVHSSQSGFPEETGLFGSCFKVNETVWLKGVTIKDGSTIEPPEVVTIKGGDGTCRKPEFVTKVLKYKSGRDYCHILFKTPIKILPDVEYNVMNTEKRKLVIKSASRSRDYHTTYSTLEKPSWNGALEYRYGDVTCKFISPTVCSCWGTSWEEFPQLIFSHYDLQITGEERILCEKAIKVSEN